MDILRVVALGLIGTVLAVAIRQHRPELALQLSIAVGVAIFIILVPALVELVTFLQDLALRADVDLIYLDLILKIIGVAYITEFGAQVCRDAQESAVASKVEMAGKITILLLAVPIVMAVLNLILGLLP